MVVAACCATLAGGCKGTDRARTDETSKAYQPPPPRPRTRPDAAPPRAADRIDPDEGLTPCVRECVRQSQMRAESPESIRRGCERRCTEQCVTACVERADRRGEKDEGTEGACRVSCER